MNNDQTLLGNSVTVTQNTVPDYPSTRFTADHIYKAIADGQVAFDLYGDSIAKTHLATVYRDGDAMAFAHRIDQAPEGTEDSIQRSFSIEPGVTIYYESCEYLVQLVGSDNATLTSIKGTSELPLAAIQRLHAEGKLTISGGSKESSPSTSELLRSLSPDEIVRANERGRQLDLAAQGGNPSVTRRTIQRWRKAARESGDRSAARNLALIGAHRRRGNRNRKLPQQIIDLIHVVGKTVYNTPTAVTKEYAYKDFVRRCQEAQLEACSRKAFRLELNNLVSVRSRQGKRAAYQAAPITMYLRATDPVHGDRPFRYVHIDHTPLDIIARAPGYSEPLGKPWLSLAMDTETRAAVGFYLSYDSPSYVSDMMVLRDIARRHGRLPDTVVTDNGPDFRCGSFKRFCQLYGIDLRYRPAGNPRHGSVLERVLGTVHSQLIHNLAGNTKLMKHVRTVTKSVRPENFVTWTLPGLHGALDYYFRVIYGEENHPAHGEGPERYLQRRLSETGLRSNRLVRLDRTLLIETCPEVDRTGTRVVDYQRGVKIDHLWYWTDVFRKRSWDGKAVQVRVDPWDARVCYVLLDRDWHQCISKLTASLRGLTRVELEYYYVEMQRRGGVEKRELTPERIAEWTRVFDANAFDPRMRAAISESRIIYDALEISAVEPVGALGAQTLEVFPNESSSSTSAGNAVDPQHDASDDSAALQSEGDEYDLF